MTAARNRTATDALIEKMAEFDALLAELRELSDDRFGIDAEAVNWGHVGNLEHHVAKLRSIADAAKGRGEHAA